MKYPGLEAVALEIAYDNGGIFNGVDIMESREEKDVINDLYDFIGGQITVSAAQLEVYDAWLRSLTQEELWLVSSGEETEMQEFLANGPEGLDDFLNEIFEHCA